MRTVPEQFLTRFTDDTVSIIRRNAEINALQSNITRLLTDNNIKHLIVKGQEAARNYPKPNLRSAGDIDILLPARDYERAKPLLHSIADSEEDEQPDRLHKGYLLGDIEVELHGALRPLLGPQVDKHLDKAQEELFLGTITFDTFHALYLFIHILQHYCNGGIGLRQIIDWKMHLLQRSASIDYAKLDLYLHAMHLTGEWDSFHSFADEMLSQSTARLSRRSRVIWNECWQSGNMGHHKAARQIESSYLKRNASTLYEIFKRFFRQRKVLPVLSLYQLREALTLLYIRLKERQTI